ncbi:hypothetical protein GCM10009647_058320 [Streptomyces sanglieri]
MGSLLFGVGGAGASERLEDAWQVGVQVLDFDFAAAVVKCLGKEFGEAACPFPD